MPDLDPQGLRRMLRLRQFPIFETSDLDELAMIAENLVEARIPEGSVIASAGSRLRDVLLIVDGNIETRPRTHTWGPRQVFGALEVLANRDVTHTTIAATDVVALQLSATDIGEVLEDNFGVLLATLRQLATRLVAVSPSPPRATAIATRSSSPLGLVERLIVLRQQLPFAAARLQALATLAHASDEITWPAGTVIAHTGELATSGFVIIEGSAVATRGDLVQVVQAGASIGHLETLAGLHHTATIQTTEVVRALRSGAPAMLDVLEDHTDVGLAMMATFSGALLDVSPRLN
jgi:CRP-like cAMP-binding protein